MSELNDLGLFVISLCLNTTTAILQLLTIKCIMSAKNNEIIIMRYVMGVIKTYMHANSGNNSKNLYEGAKIIQCFICLCVGIKQKCYEKNIFRRPKIT